MIELPEAVVIASQIREELSGAKIASAKRGNSPHKFAFYTRTADEYEEILPGKTLGQASAHGLAIFIPIKPGYTLVLGGGGERILYHSTAETLPMKHHLQMYFEGGGILTVTVQGWGNVLLLRPEEMGEHPHVGQDRLSTLSKGFTQAHFHSQFSRLEKGDRRSLKYFLISDPGAWGVGNGYLQDILFKAGLHPRRRAVDTSVKERSGLYQAIRETLSAAVSQGGRDTERDLHNRPGHYRKVLDSKTAGKPCRKCGTHIEKSQYLGGAIYFCPSCQT